MQREQRECEEECSGWGGRWWYCSSRKIKGRQNNKLQGNSEAPLCCYSNKQHFLTRKYNKAAIQPICTSFYLFCERTVLAFLRQQPLPADKQCSQRERKDCRLQKLKLMSTHFLGPAVVQKHHNNERLTSNFTERGRLTWNLQFILLTWAQETR